MWCLNGRAGTNGGAGTDGGAIQRDKARCLHSCSKYVGLILAAPSPCHQHVFCEAPAGKHFFRGCAPRPRIEGDASSYVGGRGPKQQVCKTWGPTRLRAAPCTRRSRAVPFPSRLASPSCILMHPHASSRSPCPQRHAHPHSDLALTLTPRHCLRPKSSP